jgi:hypothetical protein
MRRREFVTLLGGAAAWPLFARAQPEGKLPIIGFLVPNTRSTASEWIDAFVQRLRELGWLEGRTVVIEYRWVEGQTERFAEIAAEFAETLPDAASAGAARPVVFCNRCRCRCAVRRSAGTRRCRRQVHVKELQASGATSLRAIAAGLNERNHPDSA